MEITLIHYIVLSGILFVIGIFGVLTRRNIIGILMSIELMFNAANINLIAFNKYVIPYKLTGHIFAIFVITLAVAEAAVGLTLVLAVYRNFETVFIEKINLMKG
ncbi:MAG: NADH-quinone oxidoreductase subunit NuoK [Elusimicrobia bacterium]|nr:NADH-quinone oxidoreductase subunit NuoK [Elusimicrobiota bacterium]